MIDISETENFIFEWVGPSEPIERTRFEDTPSWHDTPFDIRSSLSAWRDACFHDPRYGLERHSSKRRFIGLADCVLPDRDYPGVADGGGGPRIGEATAPSCENDGSGRTDIRLGRSFSVERSSRLVASCDGVPCRSISSSRVFVVVEPVILKRFSSFSRPAFTARAGGLRHSSAAC
jgi:hypothetical protein